MCLLVWCGSGLAPASKGFDACAAVGWMQSPNPGVTAMSSRTLLAGNVQPCSPEVTMEPDASNADLQLRWMPRPPDAFASARNLRSGNSSNIVSAI